MVRFAQKRSKNDFGHEKRPQNTAVSSGDFLKKRQIVYFYPLFHFWGQKSTFRGVRNGSKNDPILGSKNDLILVQKMTLILNVKITHFLISILSIHGMLQIDIFTDLVNFQLYHILRNYHIFKFNGLTSTLTLYSN